MSEEKKPVDPTTAVVIICIILIGMVITSVSVAHLTHNPYWGHLTFGILLIALGVWGTVE